MNTTTAKQEEYETARLQVIDVVDSYFFAQPILDQGCATASCGASGVGCQTNAFARLIFHRAPRLKFPISGTMKIQQGDEVVVQFSQNHLLWMSLSVYVGSLVALIIGIALGQYWWGDWGGLTLGILALLSSWRLLNQYFTRFQPTIMAVRSLSLGAYYEA